MLGSRKGHGVSEATRQKIRDKLKGRKISEEARRKRIGRKLSPEHRRKIGLASKGKKHSEETKRKMRGRKHTDESRRKMSEARKGKKNPMYGKRLSEEHRRKIGRKGKLNKNYGKHLPEETKRKLSERHKGNTYAKGAIRSDEYKAKVSKRMKGLLVGDKNPFYGKKHSKETLEAISKWAKENSWIKDIDPSLLPYTKHYIITYPNGETKKVAGLKAISKEFNISIPAVHCTIKRMTQGILPTRSRSVFIGHLIEEV